MRVNPTLILSFPLVILILMSASFSVRSADGDVLSVSSGQSEKTSSTLLIDVASAGDRLVAAGQRGHIIYSDDQGKTWIQAKVPVSTLLTAIYFVDDKLGWAVGHGAVILHSSDGGKSWKKQFDGNLANEMVIAAAQKRVADIETKQRSLEGDAAADMEVDLEDAQFALEDAQFDAEVGPSKPLLDVWFKDAREGYVVGAYGFFFRTVDGGKSWGNWEQKLDNPDRVHLNSLAEVAGGAMFVVGESGYIFRSTDSGQTWENIESPYDGSLFGVIGNGNVNEVLVYGLRGHLFHSSDMGRNWDSVAANVSETLMSGAVGASGRLAVVGNSGLLMVSEDFGQTFKSRIRDDRLALTSVVYLSPEKLLLVGEGGISLVQEL